jgi:hypothetical protein
MPGDAVDGGRRTPCPDREITQIPLLKSWFWVILLPHMKRHPVCAHSLRLGSSVHPFSLISTRPAPVGTLSAPSPPCCPTATTPGVRGMCRF